MVLPKEQNVRSAVHPFCAITTRPNRSHRVPCGDRFGLPRLVWFVSIHLALLVPTFPQDIALSLIDYSIGFLFCLFGFRIGGGLCGFLRLLRPRSPIYVRLFASRLFYFVSVGNNSNWRDSNLLFVLPPSYISVPFVRLVRLSPLPCTPAFWKLIVFSSFETCDWILTFLI